MNAFKKILLLFVLGLVATLPLWLVDPPRRMNTQDPELQWNIFEQEDGLFRFEYKNNYEVFKNDNIYYLEELSTGAVPFYYFIDDQSKDDSTFEYSEEEFMCFEKEDIRLCKTRNIPENILRYDQTFLENKPAYTRLTRGETLEWLLGLRYPEKDFAKEADACFEDITAEHPQSGPICYAKKQGIVVGIAGNFYPESNINLFGLLKILFLTFNEKDLAFDEEKLDPAFFELMTTYHIAYPYIAKAYYEGILTNALRKDIWPNRHVYRDEAEDIAARFLTWQNGKPHKRYDVQEELQNNPGTLYHYDYRPVSLKEAEEGDFKVSKEWPTKLVDDEMGLNVYAWSPGDVWHFIHRFEGLSTADINKLELEHDPDRIKIQIEMELKDGRSRYFEEDIGDDAFAYLKTVRKEPLQDPNLLPNPVQKPENNSVPQMQISLAQEDFESLFEHRTINSRYPAYLEIVYPDGRSEAQSIMMKTRGNANRGYIKSSYTIEPFNAFEDGTEEFKLRSMIGDETLIKEKLFYNAFRDLGYPEPNFYEALLEVNGVPMGLYQATEAVKNDFFKDRNIDTKHYYYPRNIDMGYKGSLTIYNNDEVLTLDRYELDGDKDVLLTLMHRLDEQDPSLLEEIDTQNLFDYAMLAYLSRAFDSMQQNYYLYFDEDDEQWRIFFWDADNVFENPPEYNWQDFLAFIQNRDDQYNNMVYYLSQQLSENELEALRDDFFKRWQNTSLLQDLEDYTTRYSELFKYDNALWNGQHLERKQPYFDTLAAIEELKASIIKIQNSIEASSAP